jgi:hypothetical protein
MPQLPNVRHERFARFRSQGLLLEDAYERAGYVPDRGHASRLAARKDVRERIFEFCLDHTDVLTAERPRVIEALVNLANDAGRTRPPEAVREARLSLMDAARLQSQLSEARNRDRRRVSRHLAQGPAEPPEKSPGDDGGATARLQVV